MPRNLESEPDLTGFRESWQIYKNVINPNQRVMVPGPGGGIYSDPTLFMLSVLMAEGSGELLVVDPKYDGNTGNKIGSPEEISVGIGNYAGYERQLKHLEKSGLSLKFPRWLGPDSRAQRIRDNGNEFPGNSVDTIVDHCTLGFIYQYTQARSVNLDQDQRIELLKMIAGEYSRVLVPGGRILIQNDNVLFGFADGKWDSVLKPYLPALFPDFFWHRLRLKDICKIHIPENEYQAVRKNEKSLVSGGVMPEIRLSRFSDNPVANKQRCIRIDASKHYGPDFYILTKRPDLLG